MADDADIDSRVVEYLDAKRLGNHGMLANIADNFAEVDELLWRPWCEGVTIGDKEYKLEAEQHHLAKAALRFLWQQARRLSSIAGVTSHSPPS